MLIKNFFDLAEIVPGRHHDSTFTQNRFSDKSGHVAGGFIADHVIKTLGAITRDLIRIVRPE